MEYNNRADELINIQLVDVNQDFIPELIISFKEGKDEYASWLYSYQNGDFRFATVFLTPISQDTDDLFPNIIKAQPAYTTNFKGFVFPFYIVRDKFTNIQSTSIISTLYNKSYYLDTSDLYMPTQDTSPLAYFHPTFNIDNERDTYKIQHEYVSKYIIEYSLENFLQNNTFTPIKDIAIITKENEDEFLQNPKEFFTSERILDYLNINVPLFVQT
ncbi:hypothetical protein AGMMS49992_31760 [Clostridia bacterium]|nr:hypothetical protein AGMMS49992_31760 [Clostridia bacterium]